MRDGENKRVRLRTVMFALFAAAAVAVGAGGPAAATGDLSGAQWDMRQIGAPAAWARTMGGGVKIGIVDTGVDPNHEDLGGKVVAFANCVGGCNSAGAFDDEGHGTHVSGTAACRAIPRCTGTSNRSSRRVRYCLTDRPESRASDWITIPCRMATSRASTTSGFSMPTSEAPGYDTQRPPRSLSRSRPPRAVTRQRTRAVR